MRKPKYKQGPRFTSVQDLMDHCVAGGWVWENDFAYSSRKAMAWYWTLVQMRRAVRDGTIRKAVAL